MLTIEKVKESDRIEIVKNLAQIVLSKDKNIGACVGKKLEVEVYKEHFNIFYGVNSLEHKVAHTLLNILMFIDRTVENDTDLKEITIRKWSEQEELRKHLLKKLRLLLDEIA